MPERKLARVLRARTDRDSRPAHDDTFAELNPATAHDLDISDLQALLRRELERPLPDVPGSQPETKPLAEPEAPPEKARPPRSTGASVWRWRFIKTALAVALVGIIGWGPLQTLLRPTSVEAVVNARLVTLKSPIAGEVSAGTLPALGAALSGGEKLLRIVNPRADRGRVDDLRRAVAELNDERPALVERLDWTRTHQAALMASAAAFTAGRIRELEARRSELESDLAVALANETEAQSAYKRSRALAANGTIATAELDRNRRDADGAQARVSAARHRIVSTVVELESLRAGAYVGDSYNDRPSTAQAADEMAVRISELEAELKGRDARAKTLAAELADEEKRLALVSEFEMTAPVEGRVWETMTAPGEQVAPGQDLVKLLDCSGALVTASVSENVYNHLNVGMPARFRLRDDKHDYAGEIVNLTGIAGASANFAIEPSALMKEPYRVTVSVPGIATGSNCSIGRTGRVYFNEQPNGEGFSLMSLLP